LLSALDQYQELTAWSRVVLEELIVAQTAKKLPASYGTLRFVAVFVRALH
jgi:hypothetical protein